MERRKLSISDELQIIRYCNGVKLIKPDHRLETTSALTVGDFKKLPFSFYFLNTDSVTQSINEVGAAICGFESSHHSIGKTIEAVSQQISAQHLINNCAEVIQSNTIKIYEEENVRKDNISLQFLSVKSPWYNDANQIIGILGCSIVLGRHSLANSLSEIRKLGVLDNSNHASSNHASFNLNNLKINNIHLSHRELECLHLTVRGFTAKRVARHLGISYRTVEEYLNNIRLKAGVSSKSDLIELTLNYTLP